MPTFRNNGAWGAGVNRKLTVAEGDGNTYEFDTRITAIEDNPPSAIGISNIVVSGTQFTVYLEDGTPFGPFNLPIATFNVRGTYAAGADYAAMDLVYIPAYGLVLVLLPHTAPDPFNPDLTGTGGDVYQQVLPVLTPAPINTIAATTYEASAQDANKYHRITSISGCLIELTRDFSPGDELHFRQAGSGSMAFTVGDTGGQLNSVAGKDDATDHVGAVVTVKYIGDGEWDIFGDLAEATA